MVQKLTSQTDFAVSAYNLYKKVEKSQNPYVLSLGANVVELLLKSIVEQESGYIPEELTNHYLPQLVSYIQVLQIPYFQIPCHFIKQMPRLYCFYHDGRYFDKNFPNRSIFHEDDYIFVSKMANEAYGLLQEYKKAHVKYLNSLPTEYER